MVDATIFSEIEWSMFLLSWNNISPRVERERKRGSNDCRDSIFLSRSSIFFPSRDGVVPEIFRRYPVQSIYESSNWPSNRILFPLASWLKFNVTGRVSRKCIPAVLCFCMRLFHGMGYRQTREIHTRGLKKNKDQDPSIYVTMCSLFN